MNRILRTWLALAMLAACWALPAKATPDWKSELLGSITAAASDTTAGFDTSAYDMIWLTVSGTADTLNVTIQCSYDGGTSWAKYQKVAASNFFTNAGTATYTTKTVLLDEVGITADENAIMGAPVPLIRVICTADPTAGAASNGDSDNATGVRITLAGKR